jgi:hypothetical protein
MEMQPHEIKRNLSRRTTKNDPNETCSCCRSPDTEFYNSYWDCTLVELENASQNGCPQCLPIYKLIKLFAPDAFQGSNKIETQWLYSCSLCINSGVRAREENYELDIFRFSGKNKLTQFIMTDILIRQF